MGLFCRNEFQKNYIIIFLREKIGFKKKLSKKIGSVAAVRLSWHKGKWVVVLGQC
jgi:hypothetical protein